MLRLVWERLPEEDERETAELPDMDPTPLDPLPSTVRSACVLDLAVLADTNLRQLHCCQKGQLHTQAREETAHTAMRLQSINK